jgi:hypothetical protein
MARNPSITRTSKGVLVDGQFHETPTTPTGNRYQHVGCDMARSGKAKTFGTTPITHGMRRVTAGNVSAYHHGVAVQDEPMTTKAALNPRSVSIHDAMGTKSEPHTRGIVAHVEDGSKHLRAASRLSAKDAELSKAEGFDHSFVGHRVSKTAALPSSKRKLDR